jgi:hypothetical protein
MSTVPRSLGGAPILHRMFRARALLLLSAATKMTPDQRAGFGLEVAIADVEHGSANGDFINTR